MRRIVVFSINDPMGRVGKYTATMLSAYGGCADALLVVGRREPDEEARAFIGGLGGRAIVNPDGSLHNYHCALNLLGQEGLSGYDELVLTGDVFFGPLSPLEGMFSEMDGRGADYWTLTEHSAEDRYPYPYTPLPDISAQSHMSFICFRESVFGSKAFSEFWEALPAPGYVGAGEGAEGAIDDIPRYFREKGFGGDAFIKLDGADDLNPFSFLYEPKLLLEKYGCPIFDIRAFTVPKERILENTFGETAKGFLAAIEGYGAYDTGQIWEHLIRDAHPCDFVNALGLIYILPEGMRVPQDGPAKGGFAGSGRTEGGAPRVALCMHLHYMDLLEDSLAYAKNAPGYMDIYATASSEEKRLRIEEAFSGLANKVETRLVENRGRNESALLVGLADVCRDYDFVCYCHDKKTAGIRPNSIGRSNSYKLQQCTLPSSMFADNVIGLFLEEPRIGLLVPTEPNHAFYSKTPGNEWADDFENTRALHKELGLSSPIDEGKYPVTSYGSVLWFRTAALGPLFGRGWKYGDFPEEPVGDDASLLHAIERIYPYVCQSAGYIPAYLLSDRAAGLEILNLRESLRMVNKFAKRNGGVVDTLGALLSHFDYELFKGKRAQDTVEESKHMSTGAFIKAKARSMQARSRRGESGK